MSKVSKDEEIDIFDQFEPPYESMFIDADTPLFKASVVLEDKFIIVTHKKSKKVQEFSNKTEFYGHHGKKAGGWLSEYNDKRLMKGLRRIDADSFDIVESARVKDSLGDPLEFGLNKFKEFLDQLRSYELSSRIVVVIGGQGNYRYDLAHTQQYKGKRKAKPLLFQQLKDLVIKSYPKHIVIVDGKEADDAMARAGYDNAVHYKKTGKYRNLLAYVDKDIDMVPAHSINYDDEAPTVKIILAEEAARNYCSQLLTGDSTDNILGLPDFPEEIKEKYGMAKRKGTGPAGITKLFEDCHGIADHFDRVVECYKAYYGEEKKPFETWRGDTLEWDWTDYLKETAMLAYMNPYDDPLSYDVIKHMKKLGVNV